MIHKHNLTIKQSLLIFLLSENNNCFIIALKEFICIPKALTKVQKDIKQSSSKDKIRDNRDIFFVLFSRFIYNQLSETLK